MASAPGWVSWTAAAEMIGCSVETVRRHVNAGHIVRRRQGTGVPSLKRGSVEAFGDRWRAARASVARERASRQPVLHGPPDDGDVWLGAATTAIVLGISRVRVDQLARAGRIPSTVHNRRRWFRRQHVEQVAAARALRRG